MKRPGNEPRKVCRPISLTNEKITLEEREFRLQILMYAELFRLLSNQKPDLEKNRG
jgi:hypothetical protein